MTKTLLFRDETRSRAGRRKDRDYIENDKAIRQCNLYPTSIDVLDFSKVVSSPPHFAKEVIGGGELEKSLCRPISQ
jgi:hypothetical protein